MAESAQGRIEEQRLRLVSLVRGISRFNVPLKARACYTLSADTSRVNLYFLLTVSSSYSPAVFLITKVTVPVEFHSDMPRWIGNTYF